MAFIGRSPIYGAYEVQSLTPDSSTVTFTLDYAVGSAASIMVFYGGVYQLPGTAYSVSGGGTSITFSEAPVTGTTLNIVYLGLQLTVARTAGQETTTQAFTGNGTTTAFTLTDPPVIESGIMVFVDGILQKLNTNFSVAGSTLTFNAAPDNNAEIDVYTLVKEKVSVDTVANGAITRAKLTGTISRSTVGVYSSISTNTTAVAGGYYFVDTSAGAVTVTLPASAVMGDTVRIIDMAGTFDTNNLTVNRNSHKIQRVAEDLTVNIDGSAFDLIYSNTANGWLIFSL
jgi:hypothetical protein